MQLQDKVIDHSGQKYFIQYDSTDYWASFKIWECYEAQDGTFYYVDTAQDAQPALVEMLEAAQPYITGRLKWDGCVDIDFPEIHSCMLHFCGLEEEPILGVLMKEIYKLGPTIKEWINKRMDQ